MLLLSSCINYKKYAETDDICEFNQNISPNEFTLNLQEMEFDGTRWYFEDENIIKRVIPYKEDYTTLIKNKNNNITKFLIYSKSKKLIESSFMYLDLFVGDRIYYNEEGEVIKKEDFRQEDKYPICFKEVVEIVNKMKPNSTHINNLERSSLLRDKDTLYTWKVHVTNYHKDDENYDPKKRVSYLYTINAKTGKKIKRVKTVILHP